MGFLDNLLVGGGVAWLARTVYRNAQETRRRKSSPLSFDDGLSQEDFVEIATAIARRTPRVIGVDIVGMTVDLHIKSNSGLSDWYAEVDFNDYGHLTGSHWINTENSDSQIPSHFANAVSAQIEERTATYEHVRDRQAQAASEGLQQDPGSAQAAHPAPPGWYPTDAGPRYWNGVAWTQNVAPTGHPAYQPRFDAAATRLRPSGQASIVLAWIITLVTCGYMLPWAVAVTRGTSNRGAVGLVCFFTGWTFIGWIVALVMAFTA